jgi:hypothetical protein
VCNNQQQRSDIVVFVSVWRPFIHIPFLENTKHWFGMAQMPYLSNAFTYNFLKISVMFSLPGCLITENGSASV